MPEDGETRCLEWADDECWRPPGHEGDHWDGAAGLVWRNVTTDEQATYLAEMDAFNAQLERAKREAEQKEPVSG